MKIIKPYTEILTPLDGEAILKFIELCGRNAYKSEDKITEASARKFVASIIRRGHESVLEHYSFTVRFVCDRGVSHELVRHRLASFTQESTRYCNYAGKGFEGGVQFIEPFFLKPESEICRDWRTACYEAETYYMALLDGGCTPQEARLVLPNSLKTDVIMTTNLREWRHFFKLRTAKDAHPQMRELTVPLLKKIKGLIPVVFDDIEGVAV